MPRAKFKMVWEDGIASWLDGPEWTAAAEEEFKMAESQLESIARANAIWADRTGAARAGLTAETSSENNVISLALFHTVEYGRWLEVIQNGRFAIIGPTIESEGRRITYNAIRRIRTDLRKALRG